MNLNHAQLDPAVNRVRIPRGAVGLAAPARTPHPFEQPKADPEHPYRNTHLGWFEDELKDEKGKTRKYGFYIPETMKTSGNMVLVLIPGKTEPSDFFHECGWKEALEEKCMTAYFIGAGDGWDIEDPGYEVDTAVRALAEMKSMEYFPANAATVYAMGFGDGAKIASIFAMLYQSYLAGFAAYGDTQIDDRLIEKIGQAPSDCDIYVKRGEVPLPAMFVGPESNIVEYFKGACHVKADPLYSEIAAVWQEEPKPGASFVNDECRTEVRLVSNEDAADLGIANIVREMVCFVESFQRWAGVGNGHIRRTRLAEEGLGMIRTDIEFEGYKRYWYTFEPTAWKNKALKKYPLIVAVHGYSCSGEFFAQNSGWHRVGEERNCFVVYPTAYPYFSPSARPGMLGAGIATPHWNSGGFGGTVDTVNVPNDVNFILEIVRETLAKYPEIDPERFYLTGHSNGSMMTQLVMRTAPATFAGFAPVGAMECRNEPGVAPTDGIARNVWYTMGQYDGAGCSLEGPNGNTYTLQMLCEANGLDYASARHYTSGIYEHTIIRDADKVPMVRFTGVTNWPHTMTPEMAFIIYDEFFSQFKRHADGTLEYLA